MATAFAVTTSVNFPADWEGGEGAVTRTRKSQSASRWPFTGLSDRVIFRRSILAPPGNHVSQLSRLKPIDGEREKRVGSRLGLPLGQSGDLGKFFAGRAKIVVIEVRVETRPPESGYKR